MPVIDIGLRPSDHAALKQLAVREGRRLQDQAAILLEDAIRQTRPVPTEPTAVSNPRPDSAA